MTSFEEIQDKGLLAAKGLQSLLMEGIGAAQGVGQAVGQGIGRTTQAVGQTTQAVGSGLSSLLEKPIEGFKGLDPYTRAEIGGLVGQVIGEAITGREAPKMAETIRQVPAVLRERKEKQQEKQIEKLKLLRETQKKNTDTETTLRKEFQGVTKDFREVRNAYDRVLRSAEDPSAAGDLALIFNYMKILDPGSVVREGEFATAANSGSIPSRIRAKYNKLLEGERLDNKMRNDFVQKSKSLYKGRKETYTKEVKGFTDLAKRYGLNPDNVVIDYFLDEKEVTKTPEENNDASYSGNVTTSKGNISYKRTGNY
tara:strand:- start:44 stop:976 length:933 start_codon:yes stop_codon:yes gene_type:complete